MSNETSVKQVAQFNKIVSHVYDLICKARDEGDMESMHRNIRTNTFDANDTQLLVKAVGTGIGLKGMGGPPGMMMQQPGGMVPRVPGPGIQMSSVSPAGMQMGKLPSSIKTNIKSAQNMHPYR